MSLVSAIAKGKHKISFESIHEVKGHPDEMFVALTGDQVVLTDIRIK